MFIQKFKMYRVKKAYKRLEYYEIKLKRFEDMTKKVKQWHKESKNEFLKLYKTLSPEEVILFAMKKGFIEKENDRY